MLLFANVSQVVMIYPIQYLRGVAALMVVCSNLLSRHEPALTWTETGMAGVDIFFVISGFIMWRTTADGRTGPRAFYAKRIARIVPLYWTVTAVVVAAMLLAPRLFRHARFDTAHVVASFAFVAWPHPLLTDQLYPVVTPGWTLVYEMFFYALFGLFLLVHRHARLVGMVGVLVGLVFVGRLTPAQPPQWSFYTAPIMLEFAFGMLLGALHDAVPRIDRRAAFLTICAGIGALFAGTDLLPRIDRAFAYGLPALMIVFGTLYSWDSRDARVRRIPLLVGDASYAIYLTKVLSLPAFRMVWSRAGLSVAGPWEVVFALTGLAAVTAFGIAVHLCVEKPLAAVFGRSRRQVEATSAREPARGTLPVPRISNGRN